MNVRFVCIPNTAVLKFQYYSTFDFARATCTGTFSELRKRGVIEEDVDLIMVRYPVMALKFKDLRQPVS